MEPLTIVKAFDGLTPVEGSEWASGPMRMEYTRIYDYTGVPAISGPIEIIAPRGTYEIRFPEKVVFGGDVGVSAVALGKGRLLTLNFMQGAVIGGGLFTRADIHGKSVLIRGTCFCLADSTEGGIFARGGVFIGVNE